MGDVVRLRPAPDPFERIRPLLDDLALRVRQSEVPYDVSCRWEKDDRGYVVHVNARRRLVRQRVDLAWEVGRFILRKTDADLFDEEPRP